MSLEPDGTTAQPAVVIPTVTHRRMPYDFEPDYAIQYHSCDGADWRTWDCAFTRVEANNLLAYYKNRYGQRGEWRLAKVIYR